MQCCAHIYTHVYRVLVDEESMPQRVNSSTRRPVPYRSVGLAVLLVVLGLTMLVSGLILCLTSEDAALGVLKGWSLIILGSIVFVPGELVDEKYRLTPSA